MTRARLSRRLPAQLLIAALGAVAIACRNAPLENPGIIQRELLIPANPRGSRSNPIAGWKTFGTSTTNRVEVAAGDNQTPTIEIDNASPGATGARRLIAIAYPGWYVFSGEVRTADVSDGGVGAQLELATLFGIALPIPGLHGNSRWRKIEVYYRPGRRDEALLVTCRLGGSKRPATGKAWFRNLRLAALRGAPPPAAAQFDGDTLELMAAENTPPHSHGSRIAMLAGFLCAALAAALGWLLLL